MPYQWSVGYSISSATSQLQAAAGATASARPADTHCPICAGESRVHLTIRAWPIQCCHQCAHLFVPYQLSEQHTADVYSDHYFTGSTEGYPDYCADGALHRRRGRFYGELLARHRSPGTVFDSGSAAGYLLRGMKDAGWHGVGVEPNAAMARHAREQVGVSVQAGTLEQWQGSEKFDAVMMVQVIAHFYDLRRAMEVTSELTHPGSLWLVETWNRNSRTARFQGGNWHEFNPPSVLHWFSPEGLAALGARYGFTPIAQGRPLKRITVAHAKSALANGEATAMKRLIRAGLSLLPGTASLPYPGDDVFYMLFEKS